MSVESPEAIMAAIHQAFPLEPLPKYTLFRVALWDQALMTEISAEDLAKADIRGSLCWAELTDADLMEARAALCHFDVREFTYYIPAYLCFCLRYADVDYFDVKNDALERTVFALTRYSGSSRDAYASLSGKQTEAVVRVLIYIAEHNEDYRDDIQRSLESYWLKCYFPV